MQGERERNFTGELETARAVLQKAEAEAEIAFVVREIARKNLDNVVEEAAKTIISQGGRTYDSAGH